MRYYLWFTDYRGGRPRLLCMNARGRGQPGSRKTVRGCPLGCSVNPSKARDGKVRLNIKSLGGRTSGSEHFVMM